MRPQYLFAALLKESASRTFLETIFARDGLPPGSPVPSDPTPKSPQPGSRSSSVRKKWETDEPTHRLKELYAHAKVLFDLSPSTPSLPRRTLKGETVAPQEYGIEQSEKREIGLLTSLPLLQKVIADLREAQQSENGMAKFYFTKESHMSVSFPRGGG